MMEINKDLKISDGIISYGETFEVKKKQAFTYFGALMSNLHKKYMDAFWEDLIKREMENRNTNPESQH